MSQHTVVRGITKVPRELFDYESNEMARLEVDTHKKVADIKFVFGWDQPLQSFYLQVHDAFVAEEDANPVVWLGATADTRMYEVEELSRAAAKHGLHIDHPTQVKLYGEKDDGV